jgi:hypothetical protein
LWFYNNSPLVATAWRLEPSLRLYTRSDDICNRSTRWTPGMGVTSRIGQQVSTRSEPDVEQSKLTGPLRTESATRVHDFPGGRYDF